MFKIFSISRVFSSIDFLNNWRPSHWTTDEVTPRSSFSLSYTTFLEYFSVRLGFRTWAFCKKIVKTLLLGKAKLKLKYRCEKFSADFISSVATFDDLQLILNQMTTTDSNIVAPGEPWERLRYAMHHDHMEFVAKGSIQRLIKRKFYSGPVALQDLESAHFLKKLLFFLSLICSTPIWMFLFMFVPKSDSPTG